MIDRIKRPFSERELQVTGTKENLPPPRPATNLFSTPISYRENMASLIWDKKPCWAATTDDFGMLVCGLYNGVMAQAHSKDDFRIDTFGVKWIYNKPTHSSYIEPGSALFTDARNWKEKLTMPDLEAWDWIADAEKRKMDNNFCNQEMMRNGFIFERLTSFMELPNAIKAVNDPEQREALDELLGTMVDLGCRVFDKVCTYWTNADGFLLHEDWADENGPFFSAEVARDVLLPHMKKLVDHIHSLGRFCAMRCRGKVGDLVSVYAEAGVDTLEMESKYNDMVDLYEKYGDKIILQVELPDFDIKDDTAAVKVARDYVDTFCKPGKPTIAITQWGLGSMAFTEELYRYSRLHYLAQ